MEPALANEAAVLCGQDAGAGWLLNKSGRDLCLSFTRSRVSMGRGESWREI